MTTNHESESLMDTREDMVIARLRDLKAAFGQWVREQAASSDTRQPEGAVGPCVREQVACGDPRAKAAWLREHGDVDRASQVLFAMVASNQPVDLGCLVERARLDREDGLFDRARMKFEALLKNPDLATA